MNLSHLTIGDKLTMAFGGLAPVVLGVAGLSLKSLSDATDRFASYLGGTNGRPTLPSPPNGG